MLAASAARAARALSSQSMPLTLTTAARGRLLALAAARSPAGAVLRVAVHEGGCRGLEYRFSLDAPAAAAAAAAADDAAPEVRLDVDAAAGAAVVLDAVTLERMRGAVIDFATSLQGEMFCVASNPLAAAACGCGVSFAPRDDDGGAAAAAPPT
jgi:iron-sulfur cluster assembly accessory protein